MNYIEMSSNSVYYFIRFPETEVPVIDIHYHKNFFSFTANYPNTQGLREKP